MDDMGQKTAFIPTGIHGKGMLRWASLTLILLHLQLNYMESNYCQLELSRRTKIYNSKWRNWPYLNTEKENAVAF